MKYTLRITAIITGLISALSAGAQSVQGAANIDKLCGCFSVNFQYAETFSPDDHYKFHEREDMNGVELVLPVESSDRKKVLQHLLVINDTMVVKHWREEWVYESPELLEYKGERKWVKRRLPAADVKNKWTQTVWEVSDEPRYQGVSAWIQNDGRTYWESTVDAPLPRREYTIRNDYNILKRRNRIAVTDTSWIHEQDNQKVLRTAVKDQLIALEKGYNSYYRMEDSECASARKWWKENSIFWTTVRTEWQSYLESVGEVSLKPKVDEKVLNDHLTALWKDWRANNVKTSELQVKVKEVIARFL